MDISNSAVKTPDAESETPTRIQAVKQPPPPSTNGLLKRHPSLLPHHAVVVTYKECLKNHAVVVTYKECLKNHAASLGGHAVDGCGEFMPFQGSDPTDPTSLKCAACGCHRNFHRRDPDETPPLLLPNAIPALEYRPHHRHHPPPPPPRASSGSPDNSPSPPPISSSYYPSAPHMLLALSHGVSAPPPDGNALIAAASPPILSSNSRKRFRTKFTQNQKEKMLEFAERVEWKIQKKDDDLISEFCSEIGVEKGVLKVWMHNNKSHFCKKENQSNSAPPPPTTNGGGMSYAAAGAAAEDSDSREDAELEELRHHLHHDNSILGTNGSSSS